MRGIITRAQYWDNINSIKEKYPKLKYYSSFAEAKEKFTEDGYGYIEFQFQCIDDILALLEFTDNTPIIIRKGKDIEHFMSVSNVDIENSKEEDMFFITIYDDFIE